MFQYRDIIIILPEFKLSFIWIFSQLLLGFMKASLVLFIEPDALIQSSWQHLSENRNWNYEPIKFASKFTEAYQKHMIWCNWLWCNWPWMFPDLHDISIDISLTSSYHLVCDFDKQRCHSLWSVVVLGDAVDHSNGVH